MRSYLVIAMMMVGCGGDDGVDLTGVYEVSLEVESAPCGTDAPVADPAAYVKFTRSEILGTPYFNYERCEDAAGTDCEGSLGLFDGLSEPVDNGWVGHVTTSSGSEGSVSCLLGMTETRATLIGNQMVIERRRYEDEIPYAAATCNTDEADRRGEDMPCAEHLRIDAAKR